MASSLVGKESHWVGADVVYYHIRHLWVWGLLLFDEDVEKKTG